MIAGIDEFPLFNLDVSKFNIRFTAKKKQNLSGIEPLIRGRFGYRLKQLCCPFPNFRDRPCDDCELIGKCMYIVLFSPLVTIPNASGKSSVRKSNVRPFVFALNVKDRAVIEAGEFLIAELTLFGNSTQFFSVLLEGICSAIRSLSFDIEHIETHSLPEDGSTPCVMSRWIKAGITNRFEAKADSTVTLHFITPVRFVTQSQLVTGDISFGSIIKTIVRRLRDLKRTYGNDTDMGEFDESFFSAADSIVVLENRLFWSKLGRHSYRQKQDVYLNGFRGDIRFRGNIDPYLPLLFAGEICHIGKGTSSGNGRLEVLFGD